MVWLDGSWRLDLIDVIFVIHLFYRKAYNLELENNSINKPISILTKSTHYVLFLNIFLKKIWM